MNASERYAEAPLDPKGLEAAAAALYMDKYPGLESRYPFGHEPDFRVAKWYHRASVAITAYLAAIENPAPVEEDSE